MMVIRLNNLIVQYRIGTDTLTVLDIPAWEVAEGAQVAISGSSGSGKSTLLHVLAGLLAPTSGQVQVCGQELVGLSEAARDAVRARSISVIFQNFNLMQGYTALENVLMGMTFSPTRTDRAVAQHVLETVGLAQRQRHYPAQMSIGEQQRVAIARALVKRPALILADEPTGSLDPRHTDEVVTLLRQACAESGCALVVVSHEERVVSTFPEQIAFLSLNRAFARLAGAA
jgi:putative ABC transport system ATP-binding protein